MVRYLLVPLIHPHTIIPVLDRIIQFYRSLGELILQLREKHVKESDTFMLYINRDAVVEDTLKRMQKATFKPVKAIEVKFNPLWSDDVGLYEFPDYLC